VPASFAYSGLRDLTTARIYVRAVSSGGANQKSLWLRDRRGSGRGGTRFSEVPRINRATSRDEDSPPVARSGRRSSRDNG